MATEQTPKPAPAAPRRTGPPGPIPHFRAKRRAKPVHLFAGLLAFLALSPFLKDDFVGVLLLSGGLTLLLISAAVAVGPDRRRLVWALCLGGPSFVLSWVNVLTDYHQLAHLGQVFWLFFLIFLIKTFLKQIVTADRVDLDLIWAAVSTYLLLALAWGLLFSLLDHFSPEAFLGEPTSADFIYFSFVTLTTLGYGDIVPVSPEARALAMVEAVNGVLYTGVFIAGLVSGAQGKPLDRE
ncbi:MAG: hypothetical protein KQJ78_05985 [Deltaproteobacteria bacterium]|nr:hypothetical protein [Deltaproteobacteria bacterium]